MISSGGFERTECIAIDVGNKAFISEGNGFEKSGAGHENRSREGGKVYQCVLIL